MVTKYHQYLSKVTNLITLASDCNVRCSVNYSDRYVEVDVFSKDSAVPEFISSSVMGFFASFTDIAGVLPSLSFSQAFCLWFAKFTFPFQFVDDDVQS